MNATTTKRIADVAGASPPLDTATQELLFKWNDTDADYPRHACLHQLIEQQARLTPGSIALIFQEKKLTYAELESRANRLAGRLRRFGIKCSDLIGICLRPSFDLVVALIAVLKVGATYLPLDTLYPRERLAYMVQDSGSKLLIIDDVFRETFSAIHPVLLSLDSEDSSWADEEAEGSTAHLSPELIAYVIYTSGSTGKPKGVQVSHRSLVNLLTSMQRRPGMNRDDVLLATTTISFDIAALELFLPIITGATVILVAREVATDGRALRRELEQSGATILQATPATWQMLIQAGWHGDAQLKMLCGGEALTPELARALLKRGSSLWNMYGPTETTIWSSVAQISSADAPITIGRPVANTKMYILDEHLKPVPLGTQGDLYIGGDGVAVGYLNRPDLTQSRFLPDPFRGDLGRRMYRTGDLARHGPTGCIEWLGRVDQQVKVRGFRIELPEIELALAKHPAVIQNVVVAVNDVAGDKALVAYVITQQPRAVQPSDLREFLRHSVPPYMVPSMFVFVDAFPLTPNGKIDRLKLQVRPLSVDFNPETAPDSATAIECQLRQLWESVLNVSPVGVGDNFFDLGGHSLLVARLLNRIEQSFGKVLTMADLFRAPTIRQQAPLISAHGRTTRSEAVVPIQPQGSKNPLFLFAFNSGPVFLPLSRHLGPDQPVFSLGLTIAEAGELPVPYRMEDLARVLIRHVKTLQPEGPYFLGGLCAGGLMAYEVARQLAADGEHVAAVALFETGIPICSRGASTRHTISRVGQRAKFHFSNLQGLHVTEAALYAQGRARTALQKTRRLMWHGFYYVRSSRRDIRLRELNDILYLAARDYMPGSYAGRVALFRATNRPNGSGWDLQSDWAGLLTGALNVFEVPGHHDSILLEPNVASLANTLRSWLSEKSHASLAADL